METGNAAAGDAAHAAPPAPSVSAVSPAGSFPPRCPSTSSVRPPQPPPATDSTAARSPPQHSRMADGGALSPVSSVGSPSPPCLTALPGCSDGIAGLPSSPTPLSPTPLKRPRSSVADEPDAKKTDRCYDAGGGAPLLGGGGFEDVSSDEDGDDDGSLDGDPLYSPVAAVPSFSPVSPEAAGEEPTLSSAAVASARCPVMGGSQDGDAGTGEGTMVSRVFKSGHFIRQKVIQTNPSRGETPEHAEIGPVTYKTTNAISAHNTEHDLPLPDNWIQLEHTSGGCIYMNRTSRVCTWSRPYYLGHHSARKHSVPTCAIPCLAESIAKDQVKQTDLNLPDAALVEEARKQEECNAGGVGGGSSQSVDPLVVASVVPTIKNESLCKYFGLKWEMKEVESHCFCRHCRKLMEKGDDEAEDGDGGDPEQAEAKVATQKTANSLAMGEVQTDGSMFFRIGRKGGTQLNTAGKTPLSVLNEYCQRILRVRPEFISSETDDPKNPFQVIVTMNDMKYGLGNGPNKKVAKQLAAEMTLQVLNPMVAQRLQLNNTRQASDVNQAFEDLPVDDPGIPQLCVELGMPRPSQVLAECLRRNQSSSPMACDLNVEYLQNRTCRYKMTCGEHVVEGKCMNKKLGRQTASQSMLKLLHPHIFTWASLMALYCDRTTFNITQQPNDDQDDAEMTEALHCQQKKKDEVNVDVLNELRRRMRKLIPATDSGRPLDPKKVRQLHDYKTASVHPTQAPVPALPPAAAAAVGRSTTPSPRCTSSSSSGDPPRTRQRSPPRTRERSPPRRSRSPGRSTMSSRGHDGGRGAMHNGRDGSNQGTGDQYQYHHGEHQQYRPRWSPPPPHSRPHARHSYG